MKKQPIMPRLAVKIKETVGKPAMRNVTAKSSVANVNKADSNGQKLQSTKTPETSSNKDGNTPKGQKHKSTVTVAFDEINQAPVKVQAKKKKSEKKKLDLGKKHSTDKPSSMSKSVTQARFQEDQQIIQMTVDDQDEKCSKMTVAKNQTVKAHNRVNVIHHLQILMRNRTWKKDKSGVL